jgi:hypothetical protein
VLTNTAHMVDEGLTMISGLYSSVLAGDVVF